jgi:hypothetical protein
MPVPSVMCCFPGEISLSDTARSTQFPTPTSDLGAVDYDAIPRASIAVDPGLDATAMV